MAEFPDDADKKIRSPNWDSAEITMLQQLVNDNITVLRSKLTNSITISKKNGIWKDISSKINALGLHSRSDKEVKTKWQNLQTKAKKEYAESMKYRAQTGGGPAPKALTSETENIVEMMKDCSSFVGLKGSESSMVTVNLEDMSNSGIEDSAQSTIITEAIVHRNDNSVNESVLFFQEQPPSECRTGNESVLSFHQPPPACSTPHAPKKRKTETVTPQMLMQKQYDVLTVQEEKFVLEKTKIKLENIKLELEIRRLQQWANQEEDAYLTLQALNDN
ncbi:Hypothetical predicted protein [Mytilus galloprovincialis]|uniref:Myb-like domain-containing protein n=1 Tax=Mytilus galloprovincialis TaxID=29158 RepID=A0A8B6ET08_MYTGA|nr:Hypothetical predicted protein [Mytilus galloprovincialis]